MQRRGAIDLQLDHARSAVRGFLAWWLAELLGLLPRVVQRLLGMERRRLLVDLDRGDVCFWQGRMQRAVGEAGGAAAARSGDVDWEAVGRLAQRADEVVLILPPAEVLQRRVTLPLAAARNLREVLGFEMDRLTPFSSDQVEFDFIVRERDRDAGVVTIELYAIPREKLGRLLAPFAALKVQPAVVTVARASRSAEPNLIGAGRGTEADAGGRTVAIVSSVVTALIAVAACTLPFWLQNAYLVQLEAETAEAQRQTQTVERLKERLALANGEAAFVVQRKASVAPVLAQLDELTRVVPDGTWLNRLELSGSIVQMQGESGNASLLIPVIEDSALFQDAKFSAPLVKNPATGMERFAIQAAVVK